MSDVDTRSPLETKVRSIAEANYLRDLTAAAVARMLRCDRCEAAGQSWWLNASLEMDLRFCGHHTHVHAPSLPGKGFTDISEQKDEHP